jgi:hypothetical protein
MLLLSTSSLRCRARCALALIRLGKWINRLAVWIMPELERDQT